MASIRANCQVSYASVYVPLLFVAVIISTALSTGKLDKSIYYFSTILGTLAAWALWIKSVQRQRYVEFSPSQMQASVHTSSLLFSRSIKKYPLEGFGTVRSYVTIGRFPKNRVELVTKQGGESLLVASFIPRSGARSFWSLPTAAENIEATELRNALSSQFGFTNQGFLGVKAVGAQL
jgi:hypothetical protein